MRRRFSIHLISLLLLVAGCSKSPAPDGPDGPDGSEWQPKPKAWDGQRRADLHYEIFVRSYADTDGDGLGDLKGVAEKLSLLAEWGVNAVWMMPIHPSPSYHGYDVENYCAVNPDYGSMAEFDLLIQKAKSLKIKILLDMVVNHTSKTHPWFTEACKGPGARFRNFYLFAHKDSIAQQIEEGKIPSVEVYHAGEWHTPDSGDQDYRYYGAFSPWMPDINPENAEVMDSLYDAAKFWIDKGVDGFRLDAIKHIYQNEVSPKNISFWKTYRQKLLSFKPDIYLVGEVLDEPVKTAPYVAAIPACFNFNSWWKLDWAIQNHTGVYYPKDMEEVMNLFKASNPDYIYVTKLSNHDEDRTISKLGDNIAKAKLAMAVLLTMPGQPYIYYGEEIGMRGLKNTGDENVREPYLWDTGARDPFRSKWRDPQYNTEDKVKPLALQLADTASLASRFIELLRIRNTYEALADGNLSYPAPASLPQNLMVFKREKGDERLLVIHNTGSMLSTYRVQEQVKNVVAAWEGASLSSDQGVCTARMLPHSSIIIAY